MSPRYFPSEVALFLLNAELEHADDGLLADLTPDEALRLLPDLVTVAVSAMRALTPEQLETWRHVSRWYLSGIPRAQPEGNTA